jgi:P-type Mg2+ transporter
MGDGINDSPALTNSDVGISVDTAVDIAKETADIILLEKDLNVLLDGVMERKKNICKFNEIYKNGNKLQLWGSSFSNYCKHCITIFT